MRELTITEAEKLHGGRLDRRRKYAANDDGRPCDISGARVFEIARWTGVCSGCADYPYDTKGLGCSECGYTGRSRQEHWVPARTRKDQS